MTAECPYTLQWDAPSPSKLPLLMGGSGPHLIHGSLGPTKSSTQTASWSVQPFLQGSLVWQTDRQRDRPTEHATRSVTIGRIYVRSTAMQPNNNEGLRLLPSYTAITYTCTVNIANNKLATTQNSSEHNTNNQQQPNMTHILAGALSCYVQALGFW